MPDKENIELINTSEVSSDLRGAFDTEIESGLPEGLSELVKQLTPEALNALEHNIIKPLSEISISSLPKEQIEDNNFVLNSAFELYDEIIKHGRKYLSVYARNREKVMKGYRHKRSSSGELFNPLKYGLAFAKFGEPQEIIAQYADTSSAAIEQAFSTRGFYDTEEYKACWRSLDKEIARRIAEDARFLNSVRTINAQEEIIKQVRAFNISLRPAIKQEVVNKALEQIARAKIIL